MTNCTNCQGKGYIESQTEISFTSTTCRKCRGVVMPGALERVDEAARLRGKTRLMLSALKNLKEKPWEDKLLFEGALFQTMDLLEEEIDAEIKNAKKEALLQAAKDLTTALSFANMPPGCLSEESLRVAIQFLEDTANE